MSSEQRQTAMTLKSNGPCELGAETAMALKSNGPCELRAETDSHDTEEQGTL